MRNNDFIEAVGKAALSVSVPIVLYGSTLAHAYYQLRKQGCLVITPNEKSHARVRRFVNLGKLVRDKIPRKIAERQELGITRQVPLGLRKGFLISKLFEEALEVREANQTGQKVEELADILEVVRAIAASEGIPIATIEEAAELKRQKSGGFENGLILLQTAISGIDSSPATDSDRVVAEFIGGTASGDTVEIPFTFFGFVGSIKLDRPISRSLGSALMSRCEPTALS